MGVSGLLGLLKSIQQPTHLREFRGKTLGVDAYGWLHRGAVACAVELAQGKPTRKYIDFVMHRVRMLIYFGVKPYLVFDGDRLPSKAGTEKSRHESRAESKKAGMELLRLGRIPQAFQELQKAVDITPEMARYIIEELKAINVDYVVAPYEADSQMAYLEKIGMIDGIISEDSDLLVFGANCLLTKLDQYGDCVMIRRDDYTACRDVNLTGWTNHDLRRMAILNGCDYLPGIHKMGLKTAHRLVRKYKTIERILRAIQLESKFHVPQGYLDQFVQAEKTFLYQWVYCPRVQRLVNLTEPEFKGQLEGITYIGAEIAPPIARAVANGDVNPTTKQPIIIDLENSKSTRTPAERRAALKTEAPTSSKKQGIDTFFKAKRVPLAELDPNLFKPTQSQQRLLDQPQREWIPDPAPSRPSIHTNVTVSAPSRPALRSIQSAPHPPKRKRLCTDEDEPGPIALTKAERNKSKFFASPVGKNKSKKSSRHEFELWSDDSVAQAMSLLPTEDWSLEEHKKAAPRVFKDPDPDKSLQPAPDSVGDQTTNAKAGTKKKSPFALGPRLEVGALNARTQTSTTLIPAPPRDDLLSTPTKSKVDVLEELPGNATTPKTAVAINHPDDLTPTVPLTRPLSQRLVEASPSQLPRSSRSRRIRQFRFTGSSAFGLANNRGSEDMMIPDSDAASEATEDFIGSSSPIQRNSEDEDVAGQSPLARTKLSLSMPNLKQFAFGVAGPSLR